MIVQGHNTPTEHPSTPHPIHKPPAPKKPGKPAAPKKPSKPSAPKKPTSPKPQKPQKKSAALWDVEVDEPLYPLPGLKEGGHIH